MSHQNAASSGRSSDTTSDQAKNEANRLQEHAQGEARDVADTAKGEAQRVVGEARRQATSLVEDARQHALRQADDQTNRLSEALHEWSQQADALLDGRPDDAGTLGGWAQEASSQLERLADRVDELGFRGIVDEVQQFARRRPGAFLLGAAVAGFGVARLGRGAQGAQSSDQSSGDRGLTGGHSALPAGQEVDEPMDSWSSDRAVAADPVEPPEVESRPPSSTDERATEVAR